MGDWLVAEGEVWGSSTREGSSEAPEVAGRGSRSN